MVLCGGHQDEKESEAQLEPLPKVLFYYYKNMLCTKKNKTLNFKIYISSAVAVSKLAFSHVFKITIKALKAPTYQNIQISNFLLQK
jgi:hypothetical protein